MLAFLALKRGGIEMCGYIPSFLSANDPRPAREQLDAAYGWNPFPGFTFDEETKALSYPEDPDMFPVAAAFLRDEMILVYPHAWVMVINRDGSEWEVCRMD